ncbi:uncharacterized protein TNCV_4767871 [Trichonephila clavipes]|nr:uncharacterized protein TNCV_4767871 [Trichonephila clavipes]
MACEIKLLESEATTGFFVLLGEQGNKAVLDWVMKEGLIPSRYECPKCKKDMRLVERKGTIDGFEWRCRVLSKENPHFVCRSVRKGNNLIIAGDLSAAHKTWNNTRSNNFGFRLKRIVQNYPNARIVAPYTPTHINSRSRPLVHVTQLSTWLFSKISLLIMTLEL